VKGREGRQSWRPSACPGSNALRTSVYIDGFNLYYALKPTRYKWLDLGQLCKLLLPRNTIHRIRYFTARVVARPGNPGQLQRQDVYLCALGTVPNLSVHLGTFLSNTREAVLADSLPGHPRFVQIMHTEEKGSDVNLATS
jgi:hypothetical protein